MKIFKFLLFLIIFGLLIYYYVINIDGFLSINAPVKSEVLVVEGWIPDYALEAAVKEYRKGHYKVIITTGGRPYFNAYRTKFTTEAKIAESALIKLKIPRDSIFSSPARMALADKTFIAAKDLRLWLLNSRYDKKSFNVVTVGPHARRTLLQYKKAFGSSYNIGVISVRKPGFDSKHWYKTFDEFKMMFEESFAWIYVKLLFHPRRVPK